MGEKESLAFGGQAVLEGVMIRSRTHMVICMRTQNGEILTTNEEIRSFSKRYGLLQLPFIRGIPALFETMYLGFKSLFYSANVVLEEEGESLTYKEMILTLVMIVALSSFFIVIPMLLTTFFMVTGLIFNIIEASMRLTFFLSFLGLVSLWSDYQRLLQYHGAEHKVINAYEAGVTLDLTNAKQFSRLHPRCGTSFIFILVVVSILLFSLTSSPTLLVRLAYRVALIPVLGSLSYEILRFSDRHRSSFIMRILVMPGLRLQHLTTREPDDGMVEVALQAVNEVNSLRQRSPLE